ncbi:hypothetical protein [Gordonia sp. (in: high G+C Gram-positive bacteria)]|uniref:hypothetical protein n=1 Tax=Gordonia sp. (in: high G+C Gram-positive bacteria) TaxID=84139 RepID=UPI003C7613B6
MPYGMLSDFLSYLLVFNRGHVEGKSRSRLLGPVQSEIPVTTVLKDRRDPQARKMRQGFIE